MTRLTHLGRRYEIRPEVCTLEIGHAGEHAWGKTRTLPFGCRCHASREMVYAVRPVDVEYSEPNEPVSDGLAADVRREAARQRRNRKARETYDAYRSLGLVKTPYGWE